MCAAALVVHTATPAQSREGWFGSDRPGRSAIFYGEVPAKGEPANDETIYLSLACAKTKNFIEVLLSESSNDLKPNRTVQVILSAGGVATSAWGKTLTNDLAGVPSLEVLLPAHSAVFSAMLDAQSLEIRVGAWKTKTPLKDSRGYLKTLLENCRSPVTWTCTYVAMDDRKSPETVSFTESGEILRAPNGAYRIIENSERLLFAVRGTRLPPNAIAPNRIAEFNATLVLIDKLTNRWKGVSVNMIGDRSNSEVVRGTCRR